MEGIKQIEQIFASAFNLPQSADYQLFNTKYQPKGAVNEYSKYRSESPISNAAQELFGEKSCYNLGNQK